MLFQNQNISTRSNTAKELTVVTVLYEVVELDWVRLKKKLRQLFVYILWFYKYYSSGWSNWTNSWTKHSEAHGF